MSMYTTGEIAKLCSVSVRTVQYYDSRGILEPSALSEGGRRLYSEDDLSKLKTICFLRGMDIPIDSIKKLLSSDQADNVISIMLDEQQKLLQAEIEDRQRSVDKIAEVKKALKVMPHISTQSICDIAHIMENKKHLKKLRIFMFLGGLIMDAVQVSTLMVWIFKGIWIPFVIGMATAVLIGVIISAVYFTSTAYICPECHTVFKPRFAEVFFARHTPHTIKLNCTKCNYKGFCVETYGGVKTNAQN